MVREENVKLMCRIGLYEKNAGKKEIPMYGYFKGDYVRLNALKSVISASVVYALVAAAAVVYKMDFLLENILKMDYKKVGFEMLVAYGAWILVYWLFARIFYAKKYESIRPNIIKYNHELKKLQEAIDKEELKAKGGVVIVDDFIDFEG